MLKCHSADYRKVASTVECYQTELQEMMAKPGGVLVGLDVAAGLQMALVQGGKRDWRMAIIDLDQRVGAGAAGVKTLYGPDAKYAYSRSEKMTRLASGGWVEVE